MLDTMSAGDDGAPPGRTRAVNHVCKDLRERMPDPRLTSACAALLLLASAGARAEPVTSFAIATGEYGMRKEVPHSLGIEIQIRTPWRWNLFRPIAGVLTSSAGGA